MMELGKTSEAIDIVDCCRQSGEFELAKDILSRTYSRPDANEQPHKDELQEQCRLISEKSTSGDDGQSSMGRPKPIPAPTAESTLPSIMVLGWNFATAMARYAGNGFKRVSTELLETRLAQCQACPELENDHCRLCGCACVAENILLNKLALESEKCPLGKW